MKEPATESVPQRGKGTVSMITKRSALMMRRSFEKQTYRFTQAPPVQFGNSLGVYLHVPFCHRMCSFCPFYKELFSEELKNRYLTAILKEIDDSGIHGQAKWVYFGGGTPNTLSVKELAGIVDHLRVKFNIGSLGIELLPSLLTDCYLRDLRRIGFTKISLGVESFSGEVIGKTGRKLSACRFIDELVETAVSLGLWVNVDMMVGLANQSAESFIDDIHKLTATRPSQITIYPYMVIQGVKDTPSMSDQKQFELIEQAAGILKQAGYARKGVWIFAQGDDVYDSSRDELTQDYVGFGPAAFSTCGNWKVVNPELGIYLSNLEHNRRLAFVAPKAPAADEWRGFARMIYDLHTKPDHRFPSYIRVFLLLLKATGYSRGNKLTPKGLMFAHHVTKSVVESLPFPIQNPAAVENYQEYLTYKQKSN